MVINRSGSRYGNGRRSTLLTTLKIEVLAPMPSPSVRMTIAVKAGLFWSRRRE
jgi:hypothetical protein